jgi:hypothetical protein
MAQPVDPNQQFILGLYTPRSAAQGPRYGAVLNGRQVQQALQGAAILPFQAAVAAAVAQQPQPFVAAPIAAEQPAQVAPLEDRQSMPPMEAEDASAYQAAASVLPLHRRVPPIQHLIAGSSSAVFDFSGSSAATTSVDSRLSAIAATHLSHRQLSGRLAALQSDTLGLIEKDDATTIGTVVDTSFHDRMDAQIDRMKHQ